MSETIEQRNPRTGESDGPLAVADQAQVAAAAQRLRQAQPAWAGLGVEARCARLAQFARAIEEQREPLLQALLADTGRWHESVIEVDGVLDSLRRWVADAPGLLPEGEERGDGLVRTRQRWVPYQLVGVISPWNFPLLLSLIDAVPALAAGCAVLVKPSEVTSRFVAALQPAIDAVPELAGVLAFVTGDGRTGQAVIEVVDTLCFTGSVKTGRKVGEACAARFIPASLELGGKDPAIVLSDADIPRAARSLAWGSFVNGGQSCMSIERVYVERPVAQAFIDALAAEAGRLKLAHPDPRDGQIGPVISGAQAQIIEEQLADAYAKGARALTGGQIVRMGGDWCPPTVLVDVDHGMKIATEETFGSVLPVMVVEDEEEAVAKANDSQYGLSAAVFSGDPQRAQRIASRLHAGGVSINDAALTGMVQTAEKQSFKLSGLGGSRMGGASIRRFVRAQALLINTGEESPWWFPRAQ